MNKSSNIFSFLRIQEKVRLIEIFQNMMSQLMTEGGGLGNFLAAGQQLAQVRDQIKFRAK